MELLRRRRRTISTVLALLLAVESVAVVSAAAGGVLTRPSAAHALPAQSPAGEVLAEAGTVSRVWEPDPSAAPAALSPQDHSDLQAPNRAVLASPSPTPAPTPKPTAKPAAKPAATTVKPAAPKPTAKPAAPKPVVYRGTNHVWIPSLGINRSVSFFPCDRSAPPVNIVYRWGCAGANNVYLFGHASGVFQPLHDAYVSGRLKAGMKVIYADGSGAVHTFSVQYWRLVTPDGDIAWAYAAQSAPSMTLQTCVGANSQYRLVVRLVQVG